MIINKLGISTNILAKKAGVSLPRLKLLINDYLCTVDFYESEVILDIDKVTQRLLDTLLIEFECFIYDETKTKKYNKNSFMLLYNDLIKIYKNKKLTEAEKLQKIRLIEEFYNIG